MSWGRKRQRVHIDGRDLTRLTRHGGLCSLLARFPPVMGAAGVLVVTLACAALEASPASPAASEVSRPTAEPLYRQVSLTSLRAEQHGQPFAYTITTQTPTLTGSDDPRLRVFNEEMAGIVQQAQAEFKQNLQVMPPTPDSAASSFEVRYAVLSPPGAILSIKFDLGGYVTGAAHPYQTSRTVNFDLERGRDLALADLFLPGVDYLDTMSRYCVAQLEKRDIAFDASSPGAAPTLENYRNWNITADGLAITFDEYQVAAYAAGPQIVVIPYTALQNVIEDPGPLSPYLP